MLWRRLSLDSYARHPHIPVHGSRSSNDAFDNPGPFYGMHLLVHSMWIKSPQTMHQDEQRIRDCGIEGIQLEPYVSVPKSDVRFEIGQRGGFHSQRLFDIYVPQLDGHMLQIGPTPQLVFVSRNIEQKITDEFHAASHQAVAQDKKGPSDAENEAHVSMQRENIQKETMAVFKAPTLYPKRMRELSENSSPSTRPSGTKRTRDEFDIDDSSVNSDDGFESGSDSEEALSTYSESCCGTCTGSISFENRFNGNDSSLKHLLHLNRELQNNRANLVDFLYHQMMDDVMNAEYGAPPNDRLPPQKRFRTAKKESTAPIIEGYFHFACPFYKLSPTKYGACLRYCNLLSISDVIQHLCGHHSKPHYCPNCKLKFNEVMERDAHIRSRTCELQNSSETFDGITLSEKAKLAKQDSLILGEWGRWQRIWHTVFPDEKHVPTPYLDCGIGLAVTKMRDHWAVRGKSLVAQFLQGLELRHSKPATDEEELEHICKWALDSLIARVLEG